MPNMRGGELSLGIEHDAELDAKLDELLDKHDRDQMPKSIIKTVASIKALIDSQYHTFNSTDNVLLDIRQRISIERHWSRITEHLKHVLRVGALTALFATGCSTTAPQPLLQPKAHQYECGPVGNERTLVLPVPASDGAVVNVRFHGRGIPAIYKTSGLTQIWQFEDALYVEVVASALGFAARYMDFRGAEPGEKRKPETIFFCRAY